MKHRFTIELDLPPGAVQASLYELHGDPSEWDEIQFGEAMELSTAAGGGWSLVDYEAVLSPEEAEEARQAAKARVAADLVEDLRGTDLLGSTGVKP